MTAGELCNRTVYIIRSNESVLEAARLMKKYEDGRASRSASSVVRLP